MFPNINYKEYGRFHNVMPLNLPLPKSISMPKPYPSKPLPAWPTIFRRPLPFLFNNQSACPATFRLPVPLASTPRAFTQRRFLSPTQQIIKRHMATCIDGISRRIYGPDGCNLVFRFVPSYIDKNCLMVLFSPLENLLGLSVDRYNDTGMSKGSGFDSFSVKKCAEGAMRHRNGYLIGEHVLYIQLKEDSRSA